MTVLARPSTLSLAIFTPDLSGVLAPQFVFFLTVSYTLFLGRVLLYLFGTIAQETKYFLTPSTYTLNCPYIPETSIFKFFIYQWKGKLVHNLYSDVRSNQ